MKINRKISELIACILLIAIISSCKKFLDAKPDISLQVPSTLADLRAIMGNTSDFNVSGTSALEQPADDGVLLDVTWNGLSSTTRKNLYIWEKDVFNEGTLPNDWNNQYVVIYRANLILKTLEKIKRTDDNAADWDEIKGAALVFRASKFFEVLQVWAVGYDKQTAKNDLGIPLRLSTDFNEISTRATVAECYAQIIADLNEATPLLRVKSVYPMAPSKPVAYGCLARVYLAMQDYAKAGSNADLCLKYKADLLDYNKINLAATFPFSINNEEVIFATAITNTSATTNSRMDDKLYAEYAPDDLRKQAFFKTFAASAGGGIGFKGSYHGSVNLFNGISTSEMYLIRSESYARAGNLSAALNDLNTLLVKRYATNKFSPYQLNDQKEVLNRVLKERRKELVFRGLRWTDLKRLNKEPEHAVTIRRVLNGQIYELPPNDKRYAFPIPNSVIELTGMPQN